MMNRAAVIAAFLLSGCATAYQARGFSGGYSYTQLGENIFQISFSGNGFTSEERSADFALLRSAEVALANGYPYFVIVDSDKSASRSTYTTPTTTTGSATVSGNSIHGKAVTTGGESYEIVKPRAQNTIMGLKEKPAGFHYDGLYLIRSLRQKYGLR